MSAPAATNSAAAAPMARAQLINIGRAGDPWLFIPRALAHLTQAPADGELRFLLASAFGQLGLPSLAGEQLAALAPAAARHPAVIQLTTRLATLRDDRVPAEARIATCRANLEVLAAHPIGPIDLRPRVELWSNRTRATEVFRSACGNTLTRRDGVLLRCAPDIQDAATTVTRLLTTGTGAAPLPLHLEGAHPPCWLIELAARTPIRADGSQTPIHWLCADFDEFLDGLALADLRPVLSQSRVRVFIGPDAGDRLAAHLAARLDLRISGPVMTAPAVTTPVRDRDGRDVLAIIDHAERQQSAELDLLKQQIAAAYAPRTRAWCHARFAAASPAAPLRILLPTTRYSTFIQHATRDFATALTAAGHDAHLLIEPDDIAQLSQLAAARAIAQHQPDLIVLINYTRDSLGDSVPANIPVVTWVQDAMTHLFSGDLGPLLTEWDFVIGHLYPEFVGSFRHARRNTFPSPVVADIAKFHLGPTDEALGAKAECEIAYVSHQSGPPEAFVTELIERHAGDTHTAQLIRALAPDVITLATSGLARPISLDIDRLCTRALRRALGRMPAPEEVARISAMAARPIAERAMRHQMLGWAAELCAERGWRLKLYGRGWDRHPTLAPFAAGALEHGEHLRAAYRHAAVHLHAGLGLQHQRVMECSLSGGCTISRLKRDDFDLLYWWAQNHVAADYTGPYAANDTWPLEPPSLAPIAEHPAAMLATSIRDRLGVRNPFFSGSPWIYVDPDQRAAPWRERSGLSMPLRELLLAGDPEHAGFWDRESFRRVACSVIENADRRAALGAWQRGCTQLHFTVAGLAQRTIDLVSSSLADGRAPHTP